MPHLYIFTPIPTPMTDAPVSMPIAHLDGATVTVTAVLFAQAAHARCETEDGEEDDGDDAGCCGFVHT
jgi:hypothetical protein